MSFNKFIEKARKEPEKYRDLLLKKREILENYMRSFISCSLTIMGVEFAYVSFLISQKRTNFRTSSSPGGY